MANKTPLTGLARKSDKTKAADQATAWINEADKPATEAPVPQKRLTVDIPADLHRAAKMAALEQDTTIRELVVAGLESVLNRK